MNYDIILSKIFLTKFGQVSPKLHYIFKEKPGYFYPNIKTYIQTRYSDSFSYQETIKRMKYGVDVHPLCHICGKPVQYIGKAKKLFGTYCSNSCRGKDPKNNIKWVEGQKQYNLEHYGVKYNFQRNDVKEKRKQTLIENYGTYKLSDVPEIQQKIKETLKSKYGVETFSDFVSLKTIQNKKNLTQLEHGTFGTSKPEEIVFNLLSLIYDVKRQYRSDVYPFACDFYIPSLDLYIEYNGSWTHGKHPYDETNKEDLNTVQKWKDKHTKYYDNAINTWTIRDVNKRKIAEKNNLNYIEFWNINEFYTYINNFQK